MKIICIHEEPSQSFGEKFPDRGLADPGYACENNYKRIFQSTD